MEHLLPTSPHDIYPAIHAHRRKSYIRIEIIFKAVHEKGEPLHIGGTFSLGYDNPGSPKKELPGTLQEKIQQLLFRSLKKKLHMGGHHGEIRTILLFEKLHRLKIPGRGSSKGKPSGVFVDPHGKKCGLLRGDGNILYPQKLHQKGGDCPHGSDDFLFRWKRIFRGGMVVVDVYRHGTLVHKRTKRADTA
jgi:hypothetical protein